MTNNKVFKNYLYNLFYQILAIITPLITTPYLSRVLGAENIGIYSYALSITTYFILFGSLGVAMYGQREIAYVQKNVFNRSKVFLEIFLMRCITLCISLFIFYFTFCFRGQYSIYYKILILEIIANAIDISWFFQGLEEFKKTVIRNMIVKIIGVIFIFIFVRTSSDLNKYFLIYVLSTFLGNISLWPYLFKYTEKIKFKELNILRHLKPTIMLFIPQIATQVYTVLDKTMIGTIIADKAEVGFYEQSQKIIKLLMTLATTLGIVMMPRIAAIFAEGNHKKIEEYMKQSFCFILLLAFPLMCGIISVAYKFVPFFYGNGYEKVAPLICITSPIIVLIGLSNVTGTQYLLPTKQQNKYTISVIAGALVNLILNSLLIPKYASLGASIATVIAELSVTTVQFILIKDIIKISDIFILSYKYIISSIMMFICSFIVGTLIENNVISLLIQIFVSLVVYVVSLYILKDKMIKKGIDIIKSKF